MSRTDSATDTSKVTADILILLRIFVSMDMASQKRASSTTIPRALQSSIPNCARSCFSSYLQGNYLRSTCADTDDVDCLCSHTGTQGFTLQEGAFVCAHQNCIGQASEAVINSTYSICDNRPSALPATHTLLPTAFTARPTDQSSASPTSQPTTTPTESSASPAVISSTATQSPSPPQGLQTSQIVGISIACAATFIVAIIIAIFFVCMRRRRRQHEKLDSDKLSYAEFKPPSVAQKRTAPNPSGLKDPRGGAGGVGVAPVRYRAILPPANLFAQTLSPPSHIMPNAAKGIESSVVPTPPIPTTASRTGPGSAVTDTQTPNRNITANSILSGATSTSSSHHSTQPPAVRSDQHSRSGQSVVRPPSVLLPGRNDLAPEARPLKGRESSASQLTQFEEDGPLQSATIPTSIASRPLYPQAESSDNTTLGSPDESCSSSSITPSGGNSRRPSLRISIPGKRRSNFDFPPPPARPPVNHRHSQRPCLAAAGTASSPFVLAESATGVPRLATDIAQRENHDYTQRSRAPTVTITKATPPPNVPALTSGRVLTQTPTRITHKDSVSSRGFSQPNATAYVNASRSARMGRSRARSANAAHLTVNGERINYPTIPKPSMTPPTSFPMPSPPTPQPIPVPPPPTGPPVLADSNIAGSARSSHRTTASNASSADSLLAKRRGCERAATLERQLRIHNSHGSTSHKPTMVGPSSITTSPKKFSAAGHGRVDSRNMAERDGAVQPAVRPATQMPWPSPPPMGVRQWPSAAHVRQDSGNQRWVAPEAGQNAQGVAQQQYVACQIPPPPRPAAQEVEPPLMSPTPAQMTPTRRGDDMYLSIQ